MEYIEENALTTVRFISVSVKNVPNIKLIAFSLRNVTVALYTKVFRFCIEKYSFLTFWISLGNYLTKMISQ